MNSTPQMMSVAENATRDSNLFVKIGADLGRGGRFIASRSTGSTPSDCDGGPSMMTLMKRICIALSGFGSPSAVDRVMRERAATAVESWKQRKFWMLTKMPAGGRKPASDQHSPPDFGYEGAELTLALLDCREQRRKVVVNEDHVRRLLGDVRSATAHRHANVGHS